MENYLAIVQQTLNEQFASPVVNAADEETGKAQLTRAAAWEIHKIDPDVGLLRKESGNQVAGLSVDVILSRSTGDWVDIATATGVGNPQVTIKAHWLHNNGAYNPTGWVQPTASLAALPGPMQRTGSVIPPPVDPNPPINIPVTDTVILQALEDIAATQAVHTEMLERLRQQSAADTARIIEQDNYNTQKIQDQLGFIVESAEKTLKEVLAAYVLMNRPEKPEADAEGHADVQTQRQGGKKKIKEEPARG